MSILMAILSAFLDQFEKGGVQVAEDAITGKLSTPHVAEIAQANPTIQSAGEAALLAYEKAHQ